MTKLYKPIHRTCAWDNGFSEMPVSIDVYEKSDTPVCTGVYDNHGAMLYRFPQKYKLGYV